MRLMTETLQKEQNEICMSFQGNGLLESRLLHNLVKHPPSQALVLVKFPYWGVLLFNHEN